MVKQWVCPTCGTGQLFLIVNVAFFAVQAFADSPIFSNSLHSHMYEQDWSQRRGWSGR
jgi:hypothetical protein